MNVKKAGARIDCCTLFGFWPKRRLRSSLEDLMRAMDRCGVERACACATRGVLYDSAGGNDETWQAAQENDRISDPAHKTP